MPHDDQLQEVNDIEDNLPNIGDERHWFDFAHHVVSWVLDEKRRYLPRRIRAMAGNASVTLDSYYELFHIRGGDWPYGDSMHVVTLGAIHVCIPGVWAVEIFPPSKNEELSKALRNKLWESNAYLRTFKESPVQTAQDARGSNTNRWWKLGTIVSKESTRWIPDAIRSELPEPFSAVTVNMVQVGGSLTVACAFFELEASYSTCVDREWHTAHAPSMYTPSGCPRQLSPRSREHVRAVCESQLEIQSAARRWMSDNFPGVFASWSESQPLLQMMLFDGAAASKVLRSSYPENYAILEQLGLASLEETVVEDHPYVTLRELQGSFADVGFDAVNAVIGVTEGIREGLGDRLAGYSAGTSDSHRAIAYCLRTEMQNYGLEYALVRYTECLLKQYGRQRDLADGRYGSYKPRQIDAFRMFVLNNSIDIKEAKRDIDAFLVVREKYGPTSTIKPVKRLSGLDEAKAFDSAHIRAEEVNNNLDQVIELDAVYREVLSTIVSLGTDKRSLFLARVALWVSIVSLALAILGMSTEGDTLFAKLLKLLSLLIDPSHKI